VGVIKPLHNTAKNLRKRLTDAERLLWNHLRAKQIEGVKFRRQEPIDNYIVDFVCFENRLIIEVDGGQHAIEKEKDFERDNYLKKNGFRILRFWNNQVFTNIDGVLEIIRVNCFNTLPNPSRQGRGDKMHPQESLKNDNFKKGFTLLELIVALFIVSLVLAVVFPSFAVFGENRLKAEAREMASILRYMNDSASSRKETFVIKFDLDKNKVFWKGPEGEKTKGFEDLTGVTTQANGMVNKGELIVFFDPLGIKENLSVHMSREKKNITVTLNHLSGKVKINYEG